MTITLHEIREQVAGQLMCELLPDEWESMSEDSQYSFIDGNKWEIVQDWDTDFMIDQIETATNSWKLFLESSGVEVNCPSNRSNKV